jgi:hypothetical protein
MQNQNSLRFTYRDVFPLLQGWDRLLRVEFGTKIFDGRIKNVSQDTGRLELSTVVPGAGEVFVAFELAHADFEHFNGNGDFEESYLIFLPSGESLTLRRWPQIPVPYSPPKSE